MPGAIFLDRDGVLCENRATYVKSWEEFRWLPGAREALQVLARVGRPVVIVTNQSSINRGLTTRTNVHEIHAAMAREIARCRGRLDAIYLCPHRPDEGCSCRKPGVRLFRQAAADLGIDLERSYLIGDALSDVQAGWALKMRVILVRTGLGEQAIAGLNGEAQRVDSVRDALAAARLIEGDIGPRFPRRAYRWPGGPALRRSRVDVQGGSRT